jgi:hypothetical protein
MPIRGSHKVKIMRFVKYLLLSILLFGKFHTASAASGEMGTGIPEWGTYSATGSSAIVWLLHSATIGFPPGCTHIILSPATMGADAYKIAISTMLTARALGKPVRFFSHGERDGGCGVDYLQLKY